ncbi:reverse transcriptase [Gossypium australe]|uniref:Reverse transcriptase n=1 Tax=Gossypium australe TaxID=47621 RepID=A0A5B6VXE7_9ROSI|nr:reverse transcriptase [Gossypium australe]
MVLSVCIDKRQDNVLVAYELHTMKNKQAGNQGYFALKLDISNAYNRVEWNFLECMLSHLGYAKRWID